MNEPHTLRRPRLKLDADTYKYLRYRVLTRDGWRCQCCGSTQNLEVHHLRFRSKLGDDVLENLITLCAAIQSRSALCHSTTRLRYLESARNGMTLVFVLLFPGFSRPPCQELPQVRASCPCNQKLKAAFVTIAPQYVDPERDSACLMSATLGILLVTTRSIWYGMLRYSDSTHAK